MDLSRNHFQRNAPWNAPYTFSGKEKDVETGYGYVKKLRFFSSLAFGNEKQVFHYAHCLRRFGARYYDSGLSVWLSVDPLSDKYPSMSPYNYCANNPVMLVDPDGRDIDDIDGGDDPMGKGNDPAPNQTTNKLVPLKWKSNLENNFPYKQDQSTSQSGSTTTNNNSSNSSKKNNAPSTVSKVTFGIFLETTMVSLSTVEFTVATTALSAVELYNDPTLGNYVKTFVNAAVVGAVFIPFAGPAISFGLTGFDLIFGEQFYNYLDK